MNITPDEIAHVVIDYMKSKDPIAEVTALGLVELLLHTAVHVALPDDVRSGDMDAHTAANTAVGRVTQALARAGANQEEALTTIIKNSGGFQL